MKEGLLEHQVSTSIGKSDQLHANLMFYKMCKKSFEVNKLKMGNIVKNYTIQWLQMCRYYPDNKYVHEEAI